jgi:signal transduction histidine kinase
MLLLLTLNPRGTINSKGSRQASLTRRNVLAESGNGERNLDQSTVLIISDDADFSRVVMDRWQDERNVPAFTLMSSDLCRDLDAEGFDLAVVSAVHPAILPAVFQSLEPAGNPVLFVCDEKQSIQEARQLKPGISVLLQLEGWQDALVLVSAEILRHGETLARAHRAERSVKSLERQAALGRYMLDVRHTLNNTLTSMLGNSELLLLEPESLPVAERSQIETIRNMALRMHEILQRFSSIEKELNAVEQQAENDARTRTRAARAGA